MQKEFDLIIVGSGPSGISAAYPLLEAGFSVAILDGGRVADISPPDEPYFDWRFQRNEQWRWAVGTDFFSLKQADAVSPKLRVPGHKYVFDGFCQENRIESRGFATFGSLAQGGLSNSWGCGVSRLSEAEISECPFSSTEISDSYARVASRIGISGRADDDMALFFGLDDWAQPAISIDSLQGAILAGYQAWRDRKASSEFYLGRSRVAVLSHSLGGRKGCDRSSNCLWGCRNSALYSAGDELEEVKRKFSNLTHLPGFVVDEVSSGGGKPFVGGRFAGERIGLKGVRVLLAAGTLATSGLVMRALGMKVNQNLQSCPTAAFMLWMPKFFGRSPEMSFGLGQLSYSLTLDSRVSAFGSLFSTTGLPINEFLSHMPFHRRYGIDFMRLMLGSCVVGNLFLPGQLTRTYIEIDSDGAMNVQGSFLSSVDGYMSVAKKKLRRSFLSSGAFLLPMSFKVGRPGGDIHYAGSFPMRKSPVLGESDERGEVVGLSGVHVVDGAGLPVLSAKSHTLTLMANADRVSRRLISEIGAVKRF